MSKMETWVTSRRSIKPILLAPHQKETRDQWIARLTANIAKTYNNPNVVIRFVPKDDPRVADGVLISTRSDPSQYHDEVFVVIPEGVYAFYTPTALNLGVPDTLPDAWL